MGVFFSFVVKFKSFIFPVLLTLRIDGTDLLAILARSAKPASLCPVDLFVVHHHFTTATVAFPKSLTG
jgi:hypothetical protein